MTYATIRRVASSAPEALGVVRDYDHDASTNTRRVDYEFVQERRRAGVPDAAIARMGNWCLADVLALPRRGLAAMERVSPLVTAPPAVALFPEVAEILDHIAEQYCVSRADLLGHSHAPEYVEPRHEAFAVVWELNRFTAWQLACMFNKTVPGITYGLRRHYERLRTRGYGRDW